MRYDKEVFFVTETTEYNYDTGNHDRVTTTKVKRFANVTNQSEERMKVAYGAIKQDALTIRLQNHYDAPFDYIEYDNRHYNVDTQRKLRRNHVLWVSKL